MAGPSTSVELAVIAGLPYSRRFRITGGKAIWDALNKFEVRSQVRQGKLPSSALLYALTPHLTPSFDDEDIVIDLEMTGAETRPLVKGYYDIIVSDPGVEDARGLVIASGKVKVSTTVTAASDA